ncbi:ABC transporter permease [Parendozoicomonas haliclonae]|uniref:Dipeptide transport system permease protein DppB n=1 Tax=Parendozoicomonas haliclonae TaxID=1960125 RepID=A0A1X7AKQ7_9GAMM|nr:ABC transporter permease [Parendozoicomonas haliclonae]SMA44213.1 Dipeptide transport system permease protein DppB [Parendozoicomonas haliclonae]
MFAYIVRRLLYAIPILIGVNLLTFVLFFIVNTPDNMARAHLGDKYVTQDAIDNWIEEKGYHGPMFINAEAEGIETLTDTVFFRQSIPLFAFDFGQADNGRDISTDIVERMGPSLTLALPTFIIGIWVNICVALMVLMFRGTSLDRFTVISFVTLMSISYMFYIIGGQYLISKEWQLLPVSGFHEDDAWRFLLLPVVIGVIAGLGSGARLYRALFIESSGQDFARTARAKGVTETGVLFRHILPNTMIPILTGIVVVIPMLFMGALVMESFFSIPGLGSFMLDAIQEQDFSKIRAMVYLGAVLYIIGLILTDISYTWADPRVRLS